MKVKFQSYDHYLFLLNYVVLENYLTSTHLVCCR